MAKEYVVEEDEFTTTVLPGSVHNPTFLATQLTKATKAILLRLDDVEKEIEFARERILDAKSKLRTTIFDEFEGLKRLERELKNLGEQIG